MFFKLDQRDTQAIPFFLESFGYFLRISLSSSKFIQSVYLCNLSPIFWMPNESIVFENQVSVEK